MRLVQNGDWQNHANCRDIDTGLFFETNRALIPINTARLRMVCMACSVRRECLDEILYYESFHGDHIRAGFQAGMTPDERAVEAARRDERTAPIRPARRLGLAAWRS